MKVAIAGAGLLLGRVEGSGRDGRPARCGGDVRRATENQFQAALASRDVIGQAKGWGTADCESMSVSCGSVRTRTSTRARSPPTTRAVNPSVRSKAPTSSSTAATGSPATTTTQWNYRRPSHAGTATSSLSGQGSGTQHLAEGLRGGLLPATEQRADDLPLRWRRLRQRRRNLAASDAHRPGRTATRGAGKAHADL